MASNPLLSSFEDVLEQGVSQVKQGITQQISDTGKAVVSQVTGSTLSSSPSPTSTDQQHALEPAVMEAVQDQFNENGTQQQQQGQQVQDPQDSQKAIAELGQEKQVEAQKQLAQTRKILHDEYFQKTFNRRPQEPTVQEKLEREKQEEEKKKMEDLQEQEKKAPPIALTREQTRAETKHGSG